VLQTAPQHRSPALVARLPITRTRGLHIRASGFTVGTGYARRALAGAKTNPKLTSQPDHSIGAGHYAIHGINAPSSIGRDTSYGGIRMFNRDIIDLYRRVAPKLWR
jgi:hypothetical protein